MGLAASDSLKEATPRGSVAGPPRTAHRLRGEATRRESRESFYSPVTRDLSGRSLLDLVQGAGLAQQIGARPGIAADEGQPGATRDVRGATPGGFGRH